MTTFLAHSANAFGDQHYLEDHLNHVAELAGRYAGAFGSAEWGRLAGL